MGNTLLISIIVPIYNVEKYLNACLESLVQQSYGNIEIICVDDCSKDNSGNIIKEYEKRDSRVQGVFLTQNRGSSYARKVGVEKARGQYIMFCDADDTYVTEACETVKEVLDFHKYDILQFGTHIHHQKNCSLYDRKELERVLKPYSKDFTGDLVKACFKEHKWEFTLWNKAYAADICKKAFAQISDTYIVVAEDFYASFFLHLFSRSYRGIEKKLYNYYFGIGITGSKQLDYEQFRRHCTKLTVVEELKKFSDVNGLSNEYKGCIETFERETIEGIVWEWRNYVSISDARKAYDYLIEQMGPVKTVSELAKKYWYDGNELLDRLIEPKRSIRPGKKAKSIGVFYHRMRNGGAEKVVSELLFTWEKMGYSIVLFTEEKPSEDDYEIPEGITRIVLPNYAASIESKYKKRARYLERMIEKYDIDTMLYHAGTSGTLLWDVCLLKALQCNVVVETHSIFCGTIWYDPIYGSYLPRIFRLVDRVVALSRVDVAFWNNYCPAVYIPNPIKNVPTEAVSDCKSQNIVWVGRLAEEKKPYAMLEAFSLVYHKIPTATLTVVGDGDSDEWLTGLQNHAEKLGVEEAVNFVGFELDTSAYYQKASVHVLTSLCESFSMVLAESKSYGIPTVMFELPNLELTRDRKGIISVPQDDIVALAKGIISLLENNELRRKMGKEARESIEAFRTYDLEEAWKKLLDGLDKEIEYSYDEDDALVLEMLLKNVYAGVSRVQVNGIAGASNTNTNYEEILRRHEESINHQWEVQKWHEERIQHLERAYSRTLRGLLGRIKNKIIQ